jgi:hypothetical protein
MDLVCISKTVHCTCIEIKQVSSQKTTEKVTTCRLTLLYYTYLYVNSTLNQS